MLVLPNLLTFLTCFEVSSEKNKAVSDPSRTYTRVCACARAGWRGWEVGKTTIHAGSSRLTSKFAGWTAGRPWTKPRLAKPDSDTFSACANCAHDPWCAAGVVPCMLLKWQVIIRLCCNCRTGLLSLYWPRVVVLARTLCAAFLTPPQLAHDRANTHRLRTRWTHL